jgi:hypothetical protein
MQETVLWLYISVHKAPGVQVGQRLKQWLRNLVANCSLRKAFEHLLPKVTFTAILRDDVQLTAILCRKPERHHMLIVLQLVVNLHFQLSLQAYIASQL